MAKVDAESGIVVGESSFKWADLHPEQDRYDFARADALLAWATAKRIKVRGHTLAWHEGNPEWLEPALSPASAEKLLVDHIKTVAGHFAGKLQHWDVVNEVIHPDDNQPFSLRNSPWLKALGPRYIDLAFQATEAADPKALRVINEFGTDYTLDWQERRRVALLKLLADLLRRNVPVQAVGLQAHLDAGETTLDQKVLNRFIADITAMGLKVIVTELDVRDQRLPADIRSRDTAVADHARAWLDAVLPNPSVLGVLTWGISDRRTWLNDIFPRPDKLPQRALPLDAQLARKKLWAAIAASIDAAPVRPGA
jgi:endo-1,4-beta-xylanase